MRSAAEPTVLAPLPQSGACVGVWLEARAGGELAVQRHCENRDEREGWCGKQDIHGKTPRG